MAGPLFLVGLAARKKRRRSTEKPHCLAFVFLPAAKPTGHRTVRVVVVVVVTTTLRS